MTKKIAHSSSLIGGESPREVKKTQANYSSTIPKALSHRPNFALTQTKKIAHSSSRIGGESLRVWVVTGSVVGAVVVLNGVGLAFYCALVRKQSNNATAQLGHVNNIAAGQVVNNACFQQTGSSQNAQADDQEGCSNGPETDPDSCLYETIPETVEPYARSSYVFDVPQYHIGESADMTNPEETEGTSTFPGPEAQAFDHAGNHGEVTDDDKVESKVVKSETEACVNVVKTNTIEPYASCPYVFDVPQYHLMDAETAGETSPKNNEGANALSGPYEPGEVSDEDGVDNESPKLDDGQSCIQETTTNSTSKPSSNSRLKCDVYNREQTGTSAEVSKTYGTDGIRQFARSSGYSSGQERQNTYTDLAFPNI
uniref:Uncharacterized protein n=1 Tax=Branchiostoma floridae TaxID=7739 RepID=C3YLM3_BRAFL|eukprot:XP_002602780.1 hypothetical protein BRAFLDRAFT_93726 [Branchiostoma floridae]